VTLLGSFAAKAPNKVFLSVVLGALAGASYALIIPLVLRVLAPDAGGLETIGSETREVLGWQVSHWRLAAVFALVCAFILVARTLSQVLLLRVSLDVATELRTKIYRRIGDAPIAALERVGLARLVASITADVPMIVAGARLMPDVLTSVVTLVGMLGFLLYLNPAVFWFVMGCIVAGAVTYQLPMLLGRRYLVRGRRHLDGLHESIGGLVHGAKELKLNDAKREDYFRSVLAKQEHDVAADGKTGYTIMRVAQNYGDLIAFFVIGAVGFVFVNYHAISKQELAGVVMVLLYVTGPVAVLLNFMPQFATAQIALRKLEQLFAQIPSEHVEPVAAPRRNWRTLRFHDVGYRYVDRSDEPGFAIGPLTFEIRKGEIAFVVGGNGSGKSTLSKLISLHYAPTAGHIAFDGERVDGGNIAAFRRGIAAVYSDYHLFERVLGVEGRDVQAQVDGWLRDLALDRKVTFANGRFSTLALSDGQKRRLALVAALLEDADLYLFDEWAADQDPTFKAAFYGRILPALKAQGKAVVAVTHDDRYFHVADRVLAMHEGALVAADDADHGVRLLAAAIGDVAPAPASAEALT